MVFNHSNLRSFPARYSDDFIKVGPKPKCWWHIFAADGKQNFVQLSHQFFYDKDFSSGSSLSCLYSYQHVSRKCILVTYQNFRVLYGFFPFPGRFLRWDVQLQPFFVFYAYSGNIIPFACVPNKNDYFLNNELISYICIILYTNF